MNICENFAGICKSSLTDGEVGVDGGGFLFILRFSQVSILIVAALHSIKPVHAIPSPGIRRVAGTNVRQLNKHQIN